MWGRGCLCGSGVGEGGRENGVKPAQSDLGFVEVLLSFFFRLLEPLEGFWRWLMHHETAFVHDHGHGHAAAREETKRERSP